MTQRSGAGRPPMFALTDRIVLLLRASGTNVRYGPVRQVRATVGPALHDIGFLLRWQPL